MVSTTEILPCDGEPIEVLQLPLFALEDIEPKPGPDFEYTTEGGDGRIYTIVYPLKARLRNPPKKPADDSDKWANIEWIRFQAAIAHRRKQILTSREYRLNCARHVLDKCVHPDDVPRIVTPEGFKLVFHMALCPEVTLDLVRDELRTFYYATWGEEELLDALSSVEGSPAEYWSTRKWEVGLMNLLRMSTEEYSELPARERARRIIAEHIDDWTSSLAMDRAKKKAEGNG